MRRILAAELALLIVLLGECSSTSRARKMGIVPNLSQFLNLTDAIREPKTLGMRNEIRTGSAQDIQISHSLWISETVDSAGHVGWYTSLTLDGFGNPHIGYCDWFNGDLKYATWTGSEWVSQTVDSDYAFGGSLALDRNGYPHLSYRGDGELKYTHWTGFMWDIQVVGDNSGQNPSLALSEDDLPHISYYDIFSEDLKYAYWTGTAWNIQTVDSAGWVGRHNSLALDENGYPHIGYYDEANRDLKYARWTGSAWDIQTVDSEGWVGEYAALALDDSGYAHISYSDSVNRDLKYARWTGSRWDIQTVDRSSDVDRDVSLALDKLGHPHISYYDDYPNHDLRYAYWTGYTWNIQVVEREGDVGEYNSLALDALNRPRVSYQSGYPHYDLKYIRQMFPAFLLNKQAAPEEGLHNSDVLTYTLTLHGPGLNAQLWDPLPTDTQYITDSITSTLSPPAIYSPTAHAVLWQGVLPTDAAPVIRFQVTPIPTDTVLSSPIVNTAWLTDTTYNRSISITVIANGWHAYMPVVMRQHDS